MKKLFYLSIVLILAFIMCACGGKKEEEPIETQETEIPFVTVSVIGEENYSMDFVYYGYDAFGNFLIEVNCVNNLTDKVLVFSIDRVSVNNYMIDPWWAVEVTPECISNSTIKFDKSELERNGIENITNIDFDASVYDSDNLLDDSLYESNFTLSVN